MEITFGSHMVEAAEVLWNPEPSTTRVPHMDCHLFACSDLVLVTMNLTWPYIPLDTGLSLFCATGECFEEENQLPKEERGNQTYRLRQSGKSRRKTLLRCVMESKPTSALGICFPISPQSWACSLTETGPYYTQKARHVCCYHYSFPLLPLSCTSSSSFLSLSFSLPL